MAGVAGRMSLLCLLGLITLTNANMSPEIHSIFYNVCEDTPIGTVAFTINASDPENDRLTYSLNGIDAGYFKVDANSGVVSVDRQLDRESALLLRPYVGVSDGSSTTTLALTIVLLDANDNKPIFRSSSFDAKVYENATAGMSLFMVQATDRDNGNAGLLHYSIDEVVPNVGFDLFRIDGTTGEVKLDGSLNYTSMSTFYQLKITATDGGGKCFLTETTVLSTTVPCFITVLDVPDLDPQFLGLPYVATVSEGSPLDQPVFKVNARDQDTGINDDIIYSIEADSAGAELFKISRDDGVISVSSAVDREVTGETVVLTIKATESQPNIYGYYGSTTAQVQINILDINDNRPEFYKCGSSCVKESHFTGEVFEHALGSISFNMTVKDLDKISKTQLSLEGPDKDVFSVEPQSTASDSIVQLVVRQPQKLDFEAKQRMVLEVIATDEDDTSFMSTATVTINIMDTNDNSPKFPEDTYKLSVTEHSPVGTIIANITAEDPDTMDQGNITYKLLPESILLYFDVEPQTGSVYVKNSTLLDREVRSLYSVTLQARDTDNKPGSTVLEISVTDINDQRPVFNRDSYLVFVEEGRNLELTIEATDADMPGMENSQIVYGIVPGMYSDNFTIDSNTGVLRNSSELDREAFEPQLNGRVELSVTATDKGTPPLSTMVSVIVNVEDVNDNIPEFKASSYTFQVEEAEKGAYVGSVYAVDLDQTSDFNRISYSIVDGSFGNFIIRSSGNITLDPEVELDYEGERKQYNLRIEAADLEQKKAVVMVEVNVVDVNDERPEIIPSAPVRVKENTNITEAVGKFNGFDKDGNHSLIYELESITCRCSGSPTPCSSFILDPTGEVRVNPENTVDYEQCDQVLIEAQVVDVFTEKGENNSVRTGEMVIEIEDINDNAPQFIYSDSVFVVVSESASKGTSVAGVTATDRDTEQNGQIEFKVTAVNFRNNNQTNAMRNVFEAITTQQKDVYVGIIQTTEGLDITLKGKYLVTVTATDSGGLSNNTVLEIFSVDETHRVELGFTLSELEVEENLNEIIRALTAATRAAVEIVNIRSDTSKTSRASGNTIIVAYFVYSNGTALTPDEVERMLSDPEHYVVLGQLGLENIGQTIVNVPENPAKYVLLGIVAGLIIVLAVLTTSLLCTRKTYKRKLKAAKAMNSATLTSENQKSGPVVPGTNKYTMEGANPVLNLNIDTTLALDLDEESSDVDKVSLNSLDNNEDIALPVKEKSSIMMIQEEEGNGLPAYDEPLGVALAQRGQKKASNHRHVGFNNPAFSTSDL